MRTAIKLIKQEFQLGVTYYVSDIYKLRDWIDIDKINWSNLSRNPSAIHMLKGKHQFYITWYNLSRNPNAIDLLEQNFDKINWNYLSENPNAIHILEQNFDKIYWYFLSGNPNAIHILEQNFDKINWHILSKNSNAIHILEENMDKINWHYLSRNPNIFTYDYNKMKKNRMTSGMREELIAMVFNPERLSRICKKYNINFRELIQIY